MSCGVYLTLQGIAKLSKLVVPFNSVRILIVSHSNFTKFVIKKLVTLERICSDIILGLILIFLMINDVEYLLICLLDICIRVLCRNKTSTHTHTHTHKYTQIYCRNWLMQFWRLTNPNIFRVSWES